MNKKKALTAILKLAVIAACLFILSRKLHLSDIRQSLAHVRLIYLLPALAMILTEPVVMAYKWNILLKQKGIREGFFNIVRLIFTSNFVAIMFPTALGADALRIFFLQRQKHSLTHATASLLADRMMALGTLALLSSLGLLSMWRAVSDRHVIVVVLSTCGIALAIIAVLVSDLAFRVCQKLKRVLDGTGAGRAALKESIRKVVQAVEDIHASTRSYAGPGVRGRADYCASHPPPDLVFWIGHQGGRVRVFLQFRRHPAFRIRQRVADHISADRAGSSARGALPRHAEQGER